MDDAFTIAHEAGHSMHTLFSNENQPYATANYVIFVAEIASTFNEQIFLDYMLRHSKDKNEKLSLVAQAIDGLLATFYRQALFADYEYQVSKRVENGLSVTASDLCKIMHDLYWDYYEIDLNDEPYKDCVWAYIPHLFHSPFYVYQYATSYASSLALYQNVKEGKPNAYEKYIGLLKSGGSDDPVELVAKAGVDLTKTDAFMAVVDRLNELLDELEKLYLSKKTLTFFASAFFCVFIYHFFDLAP
ncbi:MAG: M3 family metallopeptidase [Clostridium sp.]|nr:MAG: M3 family metallopeptidase [Clostridium sp.]